MASEDSFINEVTEEVRRDRLFALMRRYGWIAVLIVVLIVGGAAVFEWRKAQARSAAQAAGDALITALEAENPEARATALAAVDLPEQAGSRAVVSLLKSAADLEADNREASASALDAVIADGEIPQIYRDLALLKRMMTGAGDIAADERISRLQPLLKPGNPFRLLAIEQKAYAEIELGETDAAIETLQGVLADAEGTEDLRLRAQRLIVALGGTLEQS